MERFAILLVAIVFASVSAQERSSFCSDTPIDVYPDQFFICEALQSFKRGHDKHALELFQRAAKWGNKTAQYRVGLMLLGGIGTDADVIEGTSWLLLANERNSAETAARLADVEKAISPDDLRLAKTRAAALRAEFGDLTALERRARWVREKKRARTGSRTGNPMATVRIEGTQGRGISGLTGNDLDAYLDLYVNHLEQIVTTVEYRDFTVIDEDVSTEQNAAEAQTQP